MAWLIPSGAYAKAILCAAISTAGVIGIALTAGVLVAGAFYALVKVQGDRIDDARTDFTSRVETLDAHIGARLTEQTTRLEQGIDALGEKIDALGERIDRVEGDARATP